MLILAEAGASVPNFQKGLGVWLSDFFKLSLDILEKSSLPLGLAPQNFLPLSKVPISTRGNA